MQSTLRPTPADAARPLQGARPHQVLPDGVARGARWIEAYCRRAVADCVVVPLLDGASRRIDLRIGPARGRVGEHLWVRDLDPATLASRDAADRLARLVRVWLQPGAGV